MSIDLNQKNRKHVGRLSAPLSSPTSTEVLSLIKSLAFFAAIAFLLKASVVEAFKIPSSSMMPALTVGDHILVNKLSYGLQLPLGEETLLDFRTPERGDVVVFTLPNDPATPEIDESQTNIIKRVVGLAGDVVQVRGTKLYLNGRAWEEDDRIARWEYGGRKNFGPVLVPEGKVLLLGDNRDQSKDSRYWNDPFLDINRIKGRAFLIYWNARPLEGIFHLIE